ncbi:MAG: hypothetical protein E7261_02610 [Lachnospiraceae bacterium]|nr:hypothetical protein [Lachnospiraceae bacterium]
MKKLLSILLIMMMSVALCFSSVGCGRSAKDDDKRVESDEKDKDKDKDDDDKDDDESKGSEEVTTPEETTTVPEETTTPEETPVGVSGIPKNFEPVVIVDDANCTFTVTGIEWEEYWGYKLNVSLVNKTATTLSFDLEYSAVNGFMCDPYWSYSIEAGKSEATVIIWDEEDLEANGITTITDIEFVLQVYDSNDWDAEDLIYETYKVYPFGEEASRTYDRIPVENELVLFDNAEFTVIVTGIDEDEDWGYYLDLYIENKTDMLLNFAMDNVSINGFMNDPYWGVEMLPGKKANVKAYWGDTALTMTGVETVTDIEFDMSICDVETWGDTYAFEEHVIIYPYGEAAYQTYERVAQDTDVLLFDNEYASMIITGYEADDFWGFSLYAYLVNKTDSDISFDVEEAKVNGIDCDPYWEETICAGKKAYVEIDWSTYSLESANIDMEAISNIKIQMEVTDEDDYTKEYVNEGYEITIESNMTSEDNIVLYQGTGYTIPVSKEWTETTVDNAELAFYYASTANDGFAENFNIVLQDLSAYDVDLEAYKDLTLGEYETMGYTVVSTEKGSVDDVDAYALVATTSVTVADGSTITCAISQIFAIHNKTAYIFSFAADEAGYNLLAEEVFEMFTSVDFQ